MGQAVKRMIACNINESTTLRDLLFRLWIAADSLSRMSKRRVLLATLAVLLGGCASGNRAVPRPFPEVSRPAARGEEASTLPIPHDSPGWQVVETALTFRGTPYRRGGTDPRGFDCSGFVHYVFGAHGLPLPRNVSNLYRRGNASTRVRSRRATWSSSRRWRPVPPMWDRPRRRHLRPCTEQRGPRAGREPGEQLLGKAVRRRPPVHRRLLAVFAGGETASAQQTETLRRLTHECRANPAAGRLHGLPGGRHSAPREN